jgi:hypothetical protein
MEFATNLGVLQKGIAPLNNSIGTLILTLTSLTTAISTTLFSTNELVNAPQRLRERIQALDREIALLGDSNRELTQTLRQQRQELEGVFNTINRHLPTISKSFNSFISLMDRWFLPIAVWSQRLLSIVFWVNLIVVALSAVSAVWDSLTRSFRERQKTIEQINDSFKQLGNLVGDTDKMAFISFREEVDKSNKILDEFNNKLKEVEEGKEIQVFLEVIEGKKTAELIDFLVRTKVKSFNIKINEDVLDTLRSFKQNVEGIIDATNKLNNMNIKVDTTGIDELSNKLKSINKNLNEVNEKELINLVKGFSLVKYEVSNLDNIVKNLDKRIETGKKRFEEFFGGREATTELAREVRKNFEERIRNFEKLKEILLNLNNLNDLNLESLEDYRDFLDKITKDLEKTNNIFEEFQNRPLAKYLQKLKEILDIREKEILLTNKLVKSIEITLQKQKQFRDLLLDITRARIRDSLVEQFTNLNQKQNNAINILTNYILMEDELIKLDKKRIDILGKIEEKQKKLMKFRNRLKM